MASTLIWIDGLLVHADGRRIHIERVKYSANWPEIEYVLVDGGWHVSRSSGRVPSPNLGTYKTREDAEIAGIDYLTNAPFIDLAPCYECYADGTGWESDCDQCNADGERDELGKIRPDYR